MAYTVYCNRVYDTPHPPSLSFPRYLGNIAEKQTALKGQCKLQCLIKSTEMKMCDNFITLTPTPHEDNLQLSLI